MTSQSLGEALERRSRPKAQDDFDALLERMKPALVKSLRRDDAAEMLMRHYLTAYRLSPKLVACTNESKLAALLLSAQVRLEPGPLGHVYLVPHKSEVVWLLGYTGIVELGRRSERLGALRARIVWDCDEYEYGEKDGEERYVLVPGPEDKRRERRLVLVTWQEKAGGKWFRRAIEVPRSRVDRAKAASPALKAQSGPWLTDEDAMWCKTGIRAVRPWLPLTTEAGYAIASDDSITVGVEVDAAGEAQPALVLSDDTTTGGGNA